CGNSGSVHAKQQWQTALPGNAPHTVQVTVSDNDQASGSANTQLIVSNVLPSNLNLSLASTLLNEGDTATLNGTFTDPSVGNTHIVVINWGDGSANTTFSMGAGVLNFSAKHHYEDVLP